MAPTITVIASGAMGAGVGRRLTDNGAAVRTSLGVGNASGRNGELSATESSRGWLATGAAVSDASSDSVARR